MSSVFDIIGPVMIGPSSSHTAGAARLAKMARLIFRTEPKRVTMNLYGSFAKTYKGHGTDRALLAGLLGLDADSECIPTAKEEADKIGLEYEFVECEEDMGHPNVVTFIMEATDRQTMKITGRSLGGGLICITNIDGMDVEITGEEFTLMTFHLDKPGVIARVTKILGDKDINISSMKVFRKQKYVDAVMLIHTDSVVPDDVLDEIRQSTFVNDVMAFEAI